MLPLRVVKSLFMDRVCMLTASRYSKHDTFYRTGSLLPKLILITFSEFSCIVDVDVHVDVERWVIYY